MLGYGIKVYHKYGPQSYITTLSYKPTVGDIIRVDDEDKWYEVLALETKPRRCYASFASNLDIYRVTGVYPA